VTFVLDLEILASVFFPYLVKEKDAITTSEVKLEFAGMIVYCSLLSYFYDLTNWVT